MMTLRTSWWCEGMSRGSERWLWRWGDLSTWWGGTYIVNEAGGGLRVGLVHLRALAIAFGKGKGYGAHLLAHAVPRDLRVGELGDLVIRPRSDQSPPTPPYMVASSMKRGRRRDSPSAGRPVRRW